MKEINKELVKTTVDLEKAFFELFAELKLKAPQCQLIRAFLVASNGNNEFEASYTDLANILYKTKGYDKTGYNNARNAVNGLEKWQQKNKITLVEIVEKGSRDNDLTKGKKEYKKSKYRFAALAKIAESYSENPNNLEAIVKFTVEDLKNEFVSAEPKKKYHPNHLIRKAKKTIYTKIGKIFELAIKVGDEPYNRCKPILDECLDILNYLDSEYKVQKNRDSFITKFEREYILSVIDDNQEKDVTE